MALRRTVGFVMLIVGVSMAAFAQTPDPTIEPRTVPLWENCAPGALGSDDAHKPTLTIYLPYGRHAVCPAIVVVPGVSYTHLASNHQGRQVDHWLNSPAVAASV